MHVGVSSSGQDFKLFVEEILTEHQGVRLRTAMMTAMMTDVPVVKVNGVGENYFICADKDEINFVKDFFLKRNPLYCTYTYMTRCNKQVI